MNANQFFEDIESRNNEAWGIINLSFSKTEMKGFDQINVDVNTPISKWLKYMVFAYMQTQYNNKMTIFLSTDQLLAIARKEEASEKDIDGNLSCVYLFLSLAEKSCIKVGHTENARTRIVDDHLRIYRDRRSDLIGYYGAKLIPTIEEKEFVALLFPMRKSSKKERECVEAVLIDLLEPYIPY